VNRVYGIKEDRVKKKKRDNGVKTFAIPSGFPWEILAELVQVTKLDEFGYTDISCELARFEDQ